MRATQLGIGIGIVSFVGGLGGGIWGLCHLLPLVPFLGERTTPLPVIIRTDPARIRPLPKDLDALFAQSRSLAKGQVRTMWRRLEKDPGDTRTRALLLDRSWFDFEGEGMNALHNEQLAWFVANTPDSPILSTKAAEILPLGNGPTRSLLLRLFDQARTKEPRNQAIRENAAHLSRGRSR